LFLETAREAMGMPWADWQGVKDAIPPAYTEYIGAQVRAYAGAHEQGRQAPRSNARQPQAIPSSHDIGGAPG
jgi:DNA (cytosine-5)-methyltransferase 1